MQRIGDVTPRVTHGVGEVPGRRRLVIDDVISTDGTLAVPVAERGDPLPAVSVAPLLAHAIRQLPRSAGGRRWNES